mgnify:FL=1
MELTQTYRLVASSRSRTTEVYQGENGALVEVYRFKSGRTGYTPISEIPQNLTLRYTDSGITMEGPLVPIHEVVPAQEG